MGLLDCEFHGIERVFDPAVVNAVSNDPSIFPAISAGRTGPLDWTPFVEDKRNVFLAGEFGLSCFEFVAPICDGADGIYEMHIRVLPEGRGKWSIGFALASAAWMFNHDWVNVLVCRVPRGNIACRTLVRWGCAQFDRTIPDGWIDGNGRPIEADVFSMTRSRWTRLNCNA